MKATWERGCVSNSSTSARKTAWRDQHLVPSSCSWMYWSLSLIQFCKVISSFNFSFSLEGVVNFTDGFSASNLVNHPLPLQKQKSLLNSRHRIKPSLKPCSTLTSVCAFFFTLRRKIFYANAKNTSSVNKALEKQCCKILQCLCLDIYYKYTSNYTDTQPIRQDSHPTWFHNAE